MTAYIASDHPADVRPFIISNRLSDTHIALSPRRQATCPPPRMRCFSSERAVLIRRFYRHLFLSFHFIMIFDLRLDRTFVFRGRLRRARSR